MLKILTGFAVLLIFLVTPSVKADPIEVTSGFLTVPGFFRAPRYSFVGQNFSMTGTGGDPGSAPSCSPCRNGDVINLSGFFAGSSLGGGSLTVNGTTLNNLLFIGPFQFTAGSVTVPNSPTTVLLTAPFTFAGSFVACPLEPTSPDCPESRRVFSAALIGQGFATLQLRPSVILNGRQLFDFVSVTYDFQTAEVPEPLTITLLATGLAGLAAKRTLRRRRKLDR